MMIGWIERFFYVALLLNCTIVLPQIIKVFKTKNVRNLSLASFLGFLFMQAVTFLHAFFHHDIALAIGMAFSVITTGTLATQIVIYTMVDDHQSRA